MAPVRACDALEKAQCSISRGGGVGGLGEGEALSSWQSAHGRAPDAELMGRGGRYIFNHRCELSLRGPYITPGPSSCRPAFCASSPWRAMRRRVRSIQRSWRRCCYIQALTLFRRRASASSPSTRAARRARTGHGLSTCYLLSAPATCKQLASLTSAPRAAFGHTPSSPAPGSSFATSTPAISPSALLALSRILPLIISLMIAASCICCAGGAANAFASPLVRHAPPTGSRHPRMHLPSCRECHRLRIPHHQRAHSSVIPQHER